MSSETSPSSGSASSGSASSGSASEFEWTDLDRRAVDTVRTLAMDSVEKVGNGHPGTAMSLAPAAYLLFQHFLRHDPADPQWLGRDRFVLSCGHSSLTLYIQLYLSGYGVELCDLEEFRTWGSLTPGHPEHGHTPGVETTTGPLGQGLATAVGMAMAARYERGMLDPEAAWGHSPFDHNVWVVASDGDLEEGITSEASSLAGVQRLGNLVVIYDDNRISIEGDTAIAFNEDVATRYEAYGWHVETVDLAPNGDVDVAGLAHALSASRDEADRPSLIKLRTIIGWPAPNRQNTGKAHGSALGADEVAATKRILGFDPDQSFVVEPAVLAHARQIGERGAAFHAEWELRFAAWSAAQPDRAELLARVQHHELPANLSAVLPDFKPGEQMATRKASGMVLQGLAAKMPELWGGSADLAESNNTTIEEGKSFLPAGTRVSGSSDFGVTSPYGRILHFGIREHAMGAILNGIALSGLTRPYGGTFLVFSDYMRGAVRLAALMQTPVTYVWTHDSIGLGEDGPTHQPVEHLWALRAIPGLAVVRPGDATEVSAAWLAILNQRGPVGLCLSRQHLPTLNRDELGSADGVAHGAYVLAESSLVEASGGRPTAILLASGSELSLALAAREILEAQGIGTRVVSVPCVEWFDEQDQEYRDAVLPPSVRARVSVEAGIAMGWHKYVGDAGRCVSLEHFGASADADTLFREFGFTPERVADAVRDSLVAAQAELPR